MCCLRWDGLLSCACVSDLPISPPPQFVRVLPPDHLGVLTRPHGKLDSSDWGRSSRKKTLQQTFNLVPGDDHIAESLTEKPSGGVTDPGRHRYDGAPHSDRMSDFLHKFAVGEGLRSNRVDRLGRALGSLGNGEFGKVAHVDRLHKIFARTEYPEYGEVAKDPGNVIHQNALTSKQQRGSQYRVGESRFAEFPLKHRFSTEVFERRVLRRICDADVDDAPNAGGASRVKQNACVLDSSRVAEIRMVEAYPVRVIED